MSATIPTKGRKAEEILAELDAKSAGDADWRKGRVFSLVYKVPGPAGAAHEQLLHQAYGKYASA